MSKKIFIALTFFLLSGFLSAQNHGGFVSIDSPQNWLISIGDSTWTSDHILELPAGEYIFKGRPVLSYSWPALYAEGVITVNSNDTLKITPEDFLVDTKDDILLPEPKVYDQNSLKSLKTENRILLKNGILLTAAAANWLSFYLKRVAEDYKDDYEAAGNLSDIKRYKQKLKNFDTYSGIALGVSSALLTSYIYMSLTE